MTDHPSSSPLPAAPLSPAARRRWPLTAAVALAAALTGGITTYAFSQGGFGPPHWGPAHWDRPGFMGGRFDPARAEERLDRGVRHLAIEIDATEQQQERLRAIAQTAVKDLLPMREKAKTAHARADELLTQPKIDRAAIEALRTELMSTADAASKRFAQAVTDVAEVLTPEQRQKAHEWLQSRRSFWRRWHRG